MPGVVIYHSFVSAHETPLICSPFSAESAGRLASKVPTCAVRVRYLRKARQWQIYLCPSPNILKWCRFCRQRGRPVADPPLLSSCLLGFTFVCDFVSLLLTQNSPGIFPECCDLQPANYFANSPPLITSRYLAKYGITLTVPLIVSGAEFFIA